MKQFCWRIEHTLIREGGFVLIQGDLGTGKCAVLRLLDERLGKLPKLSAGFKTLRERWLAHLEATLLRAVVLIDEAQEMRPAVLNELRLLTSMYIDSRTLLGVILAGDARLSAKLRREELLPLGSRIRTRLNRQSTPAARC